MYNDVSNTIPLFCRDREVWMPITWYPHCAYMYSVSTYGRVCHNPPSYVTADGYTCYDDWKMLRPFTNRAYLCVKLCHNSIEKTVFIHRLVATAFIPNPDNKPEVNHIDHNPLNNHVSNLEWMTHTENMRWANACDRITHRFGNNHPRSRPIAMYNLSGILLKTFVNSSEAERETGINSSKIIAVCRGQRYTAGCHIWRYINEGEAVETKISVPELPHESLDQINRKDYDTFRSMGAQLYIDRYGTEE